MPKDSVAFSIVIAAWNGPAALERCLMSLAGQVKSDDIEVIVVSNFQDLEVQKIRHRLSFDFVTLAPETTVPQLRTRGIESAHGAIVALIEDHCIIDGQWCAEIRNAHRLPYSIVGGSVENASSESPVDWAVYFYDYGKYMLPDVPRVVGTLSGNNVSYKKAVLESLRDHYRNGFFETFINQELRTSGYDLYFMPSAIVYHKKNYALKQVVREFYHHGRLFAAQRILKQHLGKRVIRGVASLLLPLLLAARVAGRTVQKRRHLKQLVVSFPYLVLIVVAWSYGELCGYFRGEGESLAKWR